MDYLAAFDISASGMVAQKTRLETVALNIANTHTTRTTEGGPFRKLIAVLAEKSSFSKTGDFSLQGKNTKGVEVIDIVPTITEPRRVFEPAHPDADEKGFVAYPDINPTTEMIVLMEAQRGYSANVKALNAARQMAASALEIGER